MYSLIGRRNDPHLSNGLIVPAFHCLITSADLNAPWHLLLQNLPNDELWYSNSQLQFTHIADFMVPPVGIEPTFEGYKSTVIPLY